MASDDKDKKDILEDYFKRSLNKDTKLGKVVGKTKPIMVVITVILLSIFVILPFLLGMFRSGYVSFSNGALTGFAVFIAGAIQVVGWNPWEDRGL